MSAKGLRGIGMLQCVTSYGLGVMGYELGVMAISY